VELSCRNGGYTFVTSLSETRGISYNSLYP